MLILFVEKQLSKSVSGTTLAFNSNNINELDFNLYSERMLNKERQISDLKIKLELKQSFEEELINTLIEVEEFENFDTKILLDELKEKLKNLQCIDKKQLTKNPKDFGDKNIFKNNLELLHPDLSKFELALCTYFRMNLSSKEIGVIEGITPGTVRVYKTKIKYKMKLTHEDSLNQYLCNLKEIKAA